MTLLLRNFRLLGTRIKIRKLLLESKLKKSLLESKLKNSPTTAKWECTLLEAIKLRVRFPWRCMFFFKFFLNFFCFEFLLLKVLRIFVSCIFKRRGHIWTLFFLDFFFRFFFHYFYEFSFLNQIFLFWMRTIFDTVLKDNKGQQTFQEISQFGHCALIREVKVRFPHDLFFSSIFFSRFFFIHYFNFVLKLCVFLNHTLIHKPLYGVNQLVIFIFCVTSWNFRLLGPRNLLSFTKIRCKCFGVCCTTSYSWRPHISTTITIYPTACTKEKYQKYKSKGTEITGDFFSIIEPTISKNRIDRPFWHYCCEISDSLARKICCPLRKFVLDLLMFVVQPVTYHHHTLALLLQSTLLLVQKKNIKNTKAKERELPVIFFLFRYWTYKF